MPDRHGRNVITCVFGRKGSGKSTAVGRLVEGVLRKNSEKLVLVADFLGDQAFPVDDFRRVGLEGLPDALDAGERRLIVDLNLSDVEAPEFLTAFTSAARYLPGALVVVDELDFPANIGAARVPHDMAAIISYGRHASISLIAAARRPQDVPKLLVSQADYVLVGHQAGKRELEYLKEWGFDPEAISRLRVGEFVVLDAAQASFSRTRFRPYEGQEV